MKIFIDLSDARLNVVKHLIEQNFDYMVVDLNQNLGKITSLDLCIFSPAHKWKEEELQLLPKDTTIVGGQIDKNYINKFNYYNIMQDENFVYQNALLTAECFLKDLIENTSKSIYLENILVVGSGKVAKALWKTFDKIGVQFSAIMRNEKEKPFANIFSKNIFDTKDLQKIISNYSVIINTVPVMLFEDDKNFAENSILFELSSTKCLEKNEKIKYVLCPALPARFCPETSGQIMFESIKTILEKERK